MKKICLFIVLLLCVLMIAFLQSGYTAEGFYIIVAKQQMNNVYYLQVQSGDEIIAMKCDEEVFDKIICKNAIYHIRFTVNGVCPERGKLVFIDLNNVEILEEDIDTLLQEY